MQMRNLLFLLLICCSHHAQAQDDSIQINTDRPGFSDYPKTIPKGYFQIEAGFSFESETTNLNDRIQLVNWNNTLIKYGLTAGWELRVSQTYQSERLLEGRTSPEFVWQNSSGPIVLGTKIDLLKESGLVPQTAILAEYGINTLAVINLKATDSTEFKYLPNTTLILNGI
jgi:hypothetical protein